jgi:hypothetical protein
MIAEVPEQLQGPDEPGNGGSGTMHSNVSLSYQTGYDPG